MIGVGQMSLLIGLGLIRSYDEHAAAGTGTN
jgi:hypothetical protein